MSASATAFPPAAATEHVILLHGLCRTRRSMEPMAKALRGAGYMVHNIDYPSRTAPIEALAGPAIAPAVAACERTGAARIHFVTHSLGGILVRQYLATHRAPHLGRVVMLGPPNQGSEVVDRLGGWWLFRRLNGPAGSQLGTSPDSVPNRLGPVSCPVGVIAGDRSINWINSLLIPGANDGKVAVARTRVAGLADHFVVSCSHPFLMRDRTAIRQTLAFLREGHFHFHLPAGRSAPTGPNRDASPQDSEEKTCTAWPERVVRADSSQVIARWRWRAAAPRSATSRPRSMPPSCCRPTPGPSG